MTCCCDEMRVTFLTASLATSLAAACTAFKGSNGSKSTPLRWLSLPALAPDLGPETAAEARAVFACKRRGAAVADLLLE